MQGPGTVSYTHLIQNDLPARAILESENVFIMDEARASSQDIRPLEILILNLMPLKEDTETQLLRALSNTPLQVECTYMVMSTHESTHTSASHLNKFYVTFQDIKNRRFDGMITVSYTHLDVYKRQSWIRPLVQEPMTTWSIFTSSEVPISFVFSGRWGKATVGFNAARSMVYTAS